MLRWGDGLSLGRWSERVKRRLLYGLYQRRSHQGKIENNKLIIVVVNIFRLKKQPTVRNYKFSSLSLHSIKESYVILKLVSCGMSSWRWDIRFSTFSDYLISIYFSNKPFAVIMSRIWIVIEHRLRNIWNAYMVALAVERSRQPSRVCLSQDQINMQNSIWDL